MEQSPKLPIPGQRNLLITSALPYVNNVPHLGNIVGCVLSADVFARFSRLRGDNAIYICGTDEYGTATEAKAQQEGLTPQQICDKYHAIHKEVYDWFDISFDHFGRTSTPQQTEVAQDIFRHVHRAGYTLRQSVQQLFCKRCDRFLADRFVSGECPLCHYEDARGDQCDQCGQLINAVELIKPHCNVCKSPDAPELRTSEHLFLDLPKVTPQLAEWVARSSEAGQWSPNAVTLTNAWLKEGLKPRCITRDLKWGVPVPEPGFENKVFYVWFDAPIGYISITAAYTHHWRDWWLKPDDVQLYQFMGKDNVPFHTVIFPSSLIASQQGWTLLHHVSTTEYLQYEGGAKFSKSRGTGVFGLDAKTSGIPSEVWRYYLLSNRPETSDTVFSWDELKERNNNELIANVGNLVNRAMSFADKVFGLVVPPMGPLQPIDTQFEEQVNERLGQYIAALSKVKIREGLRLAMALSSLCNTYVQDNQPWVLAKQDKERCGTVVAVVLNFLHLVAAVFQPYMPGFTAKLERQLNARATRLPDRFALDALPAGHPLGAPEIIFRKLEDKEIAALRARFSGAPAAAADAKQAVDPNAFPLDVRVAEVVDVQDHPTDPNVYVVRISLGDSTRQVVARLKQRYTPEELLKRVVVALCNLPPAEIRGVKSEAMLLVGEGKDGSQHLLQPHTDDGAVLRIGDGALGTKVSASGAANTPRPEITLKEFQKLDLKVVDQKVFFKAKHQLTVQIGSESFPLLARGVEKGKVK